MQKIVNNIKGSLSTQIFIGLGLGVIVGLFFGESVAWMQVIGDIYIRLFQMPAVPYIVVSLIGGLGALNYREAKSILIKGGVVLIALWVVTLFVVTIFQLGFPQWVSASFFSSTQLAESKQIELVELFVPTNPFTALADTVIPALVLFCLATGLALIPLPNKDGFLNILPSLKDSLLSITNFVAKLTPIGVFAIAAVAAGTLPVEAFQRAQVYMVLHALVSMILSFWVLPGFIAVLTPISFKDVIANYRTPLVTAFATGNLLIVLPIIIDRSQELLSQLTPPEGRDELEIDSPLEVLVPISFTFPSMGKLLSLAFVPFAAWYNGSGIDLFQYPSFLILGLASLFGDGILALTFLLDLLGIPVDMVQIFIITDKVSASRFGTLLAGMNTIALALIATCAINGLVRIRRRKLIRMSITSLLALLVALGGARLVYTYGFSNTYNKDLQLQGMELLRVRSSDSSVEFFTTEPPPPSPTPEGASRWEVIRERGSIRVCYGGDQQFPLSYLNAQDPPELVGFDIEMAHILGQDLGLKVQLYPISPQTGLVESGKLLTAGRCDIVMEASAITPQGAEFVTYTIPIQNFTASFLVPDSRRNEFASWSTLQGVGPIRIGVPGTIPYYEAKIKGLLPEAEFVEVDSDEAALESGLDGIDALIGAAETNSAWTLLYPSYTASIPKPIVAVPMSYQLPIGDTLLASVINAWLELKKSDGTVSSLYDYWVQGKTGAVAPPRWSIIRDVLHWVD